jgi:hypothetical protein
MTLVWAEEPEGVEHLEAALAAAHRRGSLFAVGGNRLWRAAAHLWHGELEDAVATATQARDELAGWGFASGPDYATAILVEALVERGDLAAARTALEGSVVEDLAAEGARHWHEANLELLAAEREDAAALEEAELLATRYAHARNPAGSIWRLTRAVVRHRTGDEAGARADVEEQLALARTWGAPSPIGRALRVRGELFGDEADSREAVGGARGGDEPRPSTPARCSRWAGACGSTAGRQRRASPCARPSRSPRAAARTGSWPTCARSSARRAPAPGPTPSQGQGR